MSESGGALWQQLRKLISVIDELRDIGLQKYISLPRIAVLGTQSSGKSSVLEHIVGYDFLPRGDGVVTRRPLEMRLVHLLDPLQKPWGVFEEIKGEKFYKFTEIRAKIEELTDKICGKNQNIVDKPIVLTIYSPTCPDLTVIDLPGITRIAIGGQDKNIEEITKSMALRYISDPRTIILVVIPANIDLSTSEALQIAQRTDIPGIRTIGVITKIDIMDAGTNAKKAILNTEIPLKLGYVGVKLRCQQDIKDNKDIKAALEEEKSWFAKHPIYSSMPPGFLGTNILTQKLTKILFAHIRSNLPDIIKEIYERIRQVKARLKELGPALPESMVDKTHIAWNMILDFCSTFKDMISGRIVPQGLNKSTEIIGGFQIKNLFRDLFQEFISDKYRATNEYRDKDIENAILMHEGDNLPGFPNADVFLFLISPQLEKLKSPAMECLEDIYQYLELMARKIKEKSFARFPNFGDEIVEKVIEVMLKEKERTKYLVNSIIECEQGYLFTNDPDYLKSRTEIITTDSKEEVKKGLPMPKAQQPVSSGNLFVQELRLRIDSYFKIIVKSVRDSIPKLIGSYLVKAVQEKLMVELHTKLQNNEIINRMFNEPAAITQERKQNQAQLDVLMKATKILQRDPEISAGADDEELLQELKHAKAEEKALSSQLKKGMPEKDSGVRNTIVKNEEEHKSSSTSLHNQGLKIEEKKVEANFSNPLSKHEDKKPEDLKHPVDKGKKSTLFGK